MWQRLPVWFRAVMTGLAVAGIPTVVWALLAALNLRLTPRFPWSPLLMTLALWGYWRFLGGDERRRSKPLTSHVWRLALIAGGSAVAAVWAAFAAMRGMLHIVPPADDFSRFPVWTIFAAIVMGSAVAGVVEETGFRGYMQLPLERAYGPLAAIATTSIIFTSVHLTHGTRILPFLPFYFVVAVVYGLLALLTGSILPGMALHFTGDVLMFTIQYLMLKTGAAGAVQTGRIEPIPALMAIAFGVASVISFRYLARDGRSIAGVPEPVMSH